MLLSTSKRLLHVICAFFMIALMGGAVYGWPSMRPMLRREGALRSNACETLALGRTCDDQELSLGLVFTVGAWSNQGGRLFVGIVLDRIGPRLTSCSCAFVCFIGSLIFAFASNTFQFAAGYFCIGVGGAGMQLSLQSVATLFPQNKGLVMAMLSGAFQAASSVFLFFEVLHRSTDLSLRALMLSYAGVLLFVGIACLVIWPSAPFGTHSPKAAKGQEQLEATSPETSLQHGEGTKEIVDLPLNKRSFREQLFSSEYVLMTTFFTCIVIQAQFTIGTIGTQLELKGDEGDLTRTFNLIFSLSWTITPIVGYAIDRFGYVAIFVVMNSVLLGCYLCLLSPWLGLQIVTAVLYMLGRVSIWAAFFSFNGFIFGFQNFGKLAGGGLFIASCCSLVQYPLLELTLEAFDGEFAYVNALFVGICVAMYPLILRLSCALEKSKTSRIGDVVATEPEINKCGTKAIEKGVEVVDAIVDPEGGQDAKTPKSSIEVSTVMSI